MDTMGYNSRGPLLLITDYPIAVKKGDRFRLWFQASGKKNGTNTPLLPTEIWLHIVEYVLEELYHPYLGVTSSTFASKVYRGRWYWYKPGGYADWEALRLVSRSFYRLAGELAYLRARNGQSLSGSSTDGIRALSIGDMASNTSTITSLFESATAWNQLRTMDITAGPMEPYFGDYLEILFQNSSSIKELSALYLDCPRKCRLSMMNFWARLQEAFPKLELLSLRHLELSHHLQEEACLPFLHSLTIGTLPISGEVRLPSLRHLDLGGPWKPTRPFETNHAHQLESLLLAPQVVVPIDVFDLFPNLLLFECTVEDAIERSLPEPTHPLRHLSLFVHCDASFRNNLTTLATRLATRPNISKLSFWTYEDPSKSDIEFCRATFQRTWIKVLAIPRTSYDSPPSKGSTSPSLAARFRQSLHL